MALRTDYKDDILSSPMMGKRTYEITYANGVKEYVSIEDVSAYDQEGDTFGAKDINETNAEVNKKLSKEGGAVTGHVVFDTTKTGKCIAVVDEKGNVYDVFRISSDGARTLLVGDDLYKAGVGALNLSAGSTVRLITADERLVLEKSDENTNASQFRPYYDNKCSLGTATKRFYKVYAGNSSIQTSDAREKENIIPLGGNPVMALTLDETIPTDIHSELFDRLNPVQYNFINGERICYGLIAQEVISAMESLGIAENELDLVYHEFHKDKETGEEKETFGIAYNNLIAMLIHEMQKAKAQIATLQAEVNALKGL